MNSFALSRRIRIHVQGKKHRFRAVCHLGFEKVTAEEFKSLGLEEPFFIKDGSVIFETKWSDSWRVLAFSRTCTKLLMEIHSFSAENFGRFEKEIRNTPWSLFLPSNTVPEIQVTCVRSRLYHSEALKERALPLITEALKNAEENNSLSSTQKILLSFEDNICTVSLDLGGDPLYKRGFDRFVEKAPLKETMAASILWAADFFSTKHLIDPMAGSGTFSLEGAMWALPKNPASCRSFAFQEQPGFKKTTWDYLIQKENPLSIESKMPKQNTLLKELPSFTIGDYDFKAIETILHNIKASQIPSDILKPIQQDFFQMTPSKEKCLIVLNPPYGKRIAADTLILYREIGKKIRNDFNHSNWAIICPSNEAQKALNLEHMNIIYSNHGGLNISIIIKK